MNRYFLLFLMMAASWTWGIESLQAQVPTFTFTNTPTNTATDSPIPTGVASVTWTNTLTRTPTNTATRTPTNTSTRTPTNSPTTTANVSVTWTNTFTRTPTNTYTNTFTPSITGTASVTLTNTSTHTPTNSPTANASVTFTNTPTPTPSPSSCCQLSGTVTFGTGGDFGVLAHMAVSGNILYVADYGNSQIQKFQLPGLTPAGVVPGVANPYGLAADSLGNLYVGYDGYGVVQKFDSAGNQTAYLPTRGFAMGLAVDTNGDLYVSEESPGLVEIFPWTGSGYGAAITVQSPVFMGTQRGILKQGNRLYVSDWNASKVFELDETSPYVFGAAQTVIDDGTISNPAELSMDGAGKLYVASEGNSSVVVYNAQSAQGAPFTVDHQCPLAGFNPQGAVVDGQGTLYAGASTAPFQFVRINPCPGLATPTGTLTPSLTPTPTYTITPSLTPTPFQTPAMSATPFQSYGCLAQSGDGGDLLANGAVAPVVPLGVRPWSSACGLEWIADNPYGYSPANTPTSVVYTRYFQMDPSLVSNGNYTLSFKADDAVSFRLNGVDVASCSPPTNNMGACQYDPCHEQVIANPSSVFLPYPQINTLQITVVNLVSVSTGVTFGWSGLSYRLCVVPNGVPTPTPTPGVVCNNPATLVATVIGCPAATVDLVRQYQLDPMIAYIIMRLTVLCGCQPSDILQYRLTMGWDEICAHYNIDWPTLVLDVQNRCAVLAPEIVTVNQILRYDANDPSYFPVEIQPTPVPSGLPLILSAPLQGACP